MGWLVFLRNKSKSDIWFVVFCFISSIVVFVDYIFRLYPSINVVVWAYAIGSFMPLAGLLWSFDLKKVKINLFSKFLLFLPPLLFFYFSLDKKIINEVYYLTIFGYEGRAGEYFKVFCVYAIAYNILLLFNLLFLKKTTVLYERAKINYAIIGLMLYGTITGFASLILPAYFNIYSFTAFDAFASLAFIGFITYSITRYRLMDIKFLISKSSIFALLVLIIGAIFVLLSNIVTNILSDYINIQSHWFSGFLIGLIIVIIFDPIRKILEKVTDKFLFIKTYDPSVLLAEINNISLLTIDLDLLLDSVIKKLKEIFYFKKIAFVLLDQKGKLQITKQEGFDLDYIKELVKGKEKFLSVYFSGNKNIWVIPELKAAYDSGHYIPKNKEILFSLYDIDVNLVVPLFVKDEVIGLILIGDKRSDNLYVHKDINIISAIAGQLAMAIENSKLYEKEKEFNKKLKVEVKKAVYKLEQANKELQRLDDAKSEFLSIASHQLRTPTTIIKGYISMMQEGSFGKVSKLVKQNLDKVYLATERLLNLIENLLDISRIESGRLEFNMVKVNLTKIAKELKEEFLKRAGEKKIKLSVFAPENLPEVTADALKIKEVASNLVDNAVKYTKEGEISLNLHQEGTSVVFSVIDTGIGMSTEEIGRLFNKFVRGDNMSTIHPEGNGLGLYFARVVIENMGGRIWAESAGKGKGSKFCFSLPLADKKKAIKIKS